MIKLYKRMGEKTLYWEAWDDKDGTVTVHWGTVGKTGKNKSVRIRPGESADTAINRKSKVSRSEGYEEIDIDDHAQIIVQFKTDDTWGDSADLEKRYEVEDLLNQCLGWTGNGHCDGGDIGSGTINAFALVVDPYLARDAVVAALKELGLAEGAVIAMNREDDYQVLWPEDFVGEFSII